MFQDLYELMGMMALLMISGFFLRKKNIITNEGKKCLTDLILYVILPCNIIKAFTAEFQPDFLMQFLQVFLAAASVQVISLIISNFCYNHVRDGEKQVYQYGTVCSNSGFMGNPLAEGIFGNTGLLFASIFLIPMRIIMWTAGVSYFQKGADRKEAYKKVLKHPCMLATYFGMMIMLFQWKLPGIVDMTVRSFSSCCTSLTMMYIGTNLVDVKWKTLITKNQLFFSFIRLIGIPFLVCSLGTLCKLNPLVVGVCTILSATPAGSTTSLLASKYGADESSAAKCVVFTTALSTLTIPVWSVLLLKMMQ